MNRTSIHTQCAKSTNRTCTITNYDKPTYCIHIAFRHKFREQFKPKCPLQYFMTAILDVLNNSIRKRVTAKSSECSSAFESGQTSRPALPIEELKARYQTVPVVSIRLCCAPRKEVVKMLEDLEGNRLSNQSLIMVS